MDAKEYLDNQMLRDSRFEVKKDTFGLSSRTYNGLYNGLWKYLILLEHEKNSSDLFEPRYKPSLYSLSEIPGIDEYQKTIENDHNKIFLSKSNLCRFLVEKNIPIKFIPHVGQVAIKEIQLMIKDFYKI